MKLCKDCKHFDTVFFNCARGERVAGVDPVDGHSIYRFAVLEPARWQRESIMPWKCGKKARHFSARGAK